MSAPAPNPSSPDAADPADAWERALLDRQLASLDRLADMGLAIGAAIERRATVEPAPEPDTELRHAVIDFARVSRAVRLTYALQSRLVAEFKGKPRSRAAEAATSSEDDEETHGIAWDEPPGEQQRRRVRRIIRRVAEASALDREAAERLLREGAERLDDDELYGDIMIRPVAEIVARICKDLGLEAEWERLAGESWMQEAMVAEATGLPFAARWPRRTQVPPPPPRPSG